MKIVLLGICLLLIVCLIVTTVNYWNTKDYEAVIAGVFITFVMTIVSFKIYKAKI